MAEFAEESGPIFSFTPLETSLECLSSRERKEQLVQYNLDQGLHIQKFRIVGGNLKSTYDYEEVIKAFMASANCTKDSQISGTALIPIEYQADLLNSSIMSMDFFDRLEENDIVGPGGRIMGCYDEVYDDIVVSDKLREMLLNAESENISIYSEEERNEIIFKLFRLFVVGGSLAQPDGTTERYLDITKAFYKELITVYRDATTEEVKISGRVYQIEKVNGLSLFQDIDSVHNFFMLIIDPLKRIVTVLKYTHKSFW